ncbi:substrate-binding periplasmic protein [Moraxella oblonga]|uniref:substrate-binding periplasmic protein n=1 Tax=Moraxella oblonga TaxID=200413 RepID=UPI00082ECB2D|nr:transporter substrate-binding domain-containing protein [Moraxella oblonga]
MKITSPLLFFVIAFGVVGCGNDTSSTNQSTTSNASEPAATASNLPTVVLATTGTGAPITYKDDNGNLTGIDVDVVKAIGAKEGFNVEVVQVAWKNIFTGLEQKQYDIAVAGISWTEERAGKYALTNSYFSNPTSLIYKDESTIKPKSLSELGNARVSVLAGSSYEKLLQNASVGKIMPVDKGINGFIAMIRGQADAYIHSNINLRYFQANYPDQHLQIQIVENPDEPSAQHVMALNKDNTDLLEKLNNGIAKLKAEGEIDKITNKHLAVAHMNPEEKQ